MEQNTATHQMRLTRPAEATGYLRDVARNEHSINIDRATCHGSERSGFTLEGSGSIDNIPVGFVFHTYPDGHVDKARIDYGNGPVSVDDADGRLMGYIAAGDAEEGDPFEGL